MCFFLQLLESFYKHLFCNKPGNNFDVHLIKINNVGNIQYLIFEKFHYGKRNKHSEVYLEPRITHKYLVFMFQFI